MHRAERGPAVLLRVDDDADADEVVDLVELLAPHDHLLVDAPEVLRPAGHVGVDAERREPAAERPRRPRSSSSSRRGRTGRDHLLDLGVALRVQRLEGEILELPLDLLDAEAVRERRVDVERLLGGAVLLPLRHRPTSVRMLCSRSASLMTRTRQSFAIATSILRTVAACWASFEEKCSRSSLVTPSTICRDHRAELGLELVERDLGVLDDVVQEGRGGARRVEAELGDDRRHGERVRDVRLAREARLAGVGATGDVEGPLDDGGVLFRTVRRQHVEQPFDRHLSVDHRRRGGARSLGEGVHDGHVPGYRRSTNRSALHKGAKSPDPKLAASTPRSGRRRQRPDRDTGAPAGSGWVRR